MRRMHDFPPNWNVCPRPHLLHIHTERIPNTLHGVDLTWAWACPQPAHKRRFTHALLTDLTFPPLPGTSKCQLMCSALEKCLQDSFVLNSPETFFTKCQDSGIGFGRLQVCLNDSPLDLSSHRVHPGYLLRSRSPHSRFTRCLLGHRIGHLIAQIQSPCHDSQS